MPCVLPVIGLKLRSLASHKVKFSGLIYGACSVLVFSVIGAFMVYAIHLIGGWGGHISNPWISYTMGALFVAFGLHSLEWIPGYLNIERFTSHSISGIAGVVVTGLMAPLVASSCLAPVLGTVLAAAMSYGSVTSIILFAFIGLGMALPFILFDFFPKLINWIPKTGKWSVAIKKGSGILMLLTAFWLFTL